MFKTIKINGRSVCYHNETTFIVQVGIGLRSGKLAVVVSDGIKHRR
jgi:hypothetical protein